MKKISLILVAGILSLASCKKDLEKKFEPGQDTTGEVKVSKMSEIKVPANFKWELTKAVSVKVNLEDNSFGALKHKIQIFLEDPSNKGISLAEGALSLAQEFESTVAVPSATKELFVVRTAPDNSKMIEKVTISGTNSILLNIKPVLKKTNSLGKSAGPDCTTGCGTSINNPTGNLTYSAGVTCLTGSVSINNLTLQNNAIVRICGTGSINNINFNGTSSSQLIFTSTANINFTSSMPVDGNLINYGTITSDANANININSTGVFTNHGTVMAGKNFNPNGSSVIVNNGLIDVANKLLNSSGCDFTNNCKLIIHDDFDNNGLFKNYGYIKCFEEATIQGGSNNEFKQYNGAMLSTKDIQVNGTITGFGTSSLIKVTGQSKGNSQGLVNGAQSYCDANGIEGPWNATIGGGAIQSCSLNIAVTACNPEGNGTGPNPNPDTDGDGVIDASDCYPSDPNKAFCNAVPTGTLAFEDQWPFTGDYDMNDVVVSYNYNVVTNAANNVVRVEATYVLRATGGSFRNGFAVQFPVDRNKVSGVTGATLEAGQTKAVLVIFNDMHQHNSAWNTVPSATTSPATTFTVSFNITDGPSLATFGLGAYNPFIWNGTAGFGRGYEIHLPGQLPTDLANGSLFTTGRDGSNISTGDTYVTNNGRFPWAINIPASFDYPIEKADINTAYTKFATWVTSGGSSFSNWYTNTSGYRNIANIY
ncbi:MAG: LruC domain-containing protein [Bacteroidia bacterium]